MQATELKVVNPYVGPRPFEERHQGLFFGRDWEANELVSLIVAHPAVLLYAQSGAGKTSLINAKLIPLLRDEEGLQVMPVARVRGEVPPEVQPEQIENLFVFNTLWGWVERGADPAQLVGLSLSAFLEGRPRPKDEEGQPTLQVVIFDQFEELFTLYPERWAEREGFFVQIAEALAKDPFLRVLFVLREEYLAQLDPYVALLPERLRTRFRLERLRQEAALAAVKGPLVGTGRSFAPGVAESLVEELLKIRVETRVGETVELPGEFVEPVQLQVVCRSLWEELPPDVTEITRPHLWAFGDVDQALRTFYERALRSAVQQTKVGEGKLRAWFERDLITPMGTRGTAYRGTKSTGGVPNAAIDVLDSQHLIRAERRAGARWYELTHDRFIRPIQKSNEAWRAARRERWLRLGGGVAVILVLLFVGITALQATISGRKVAQVQTTATVAIQEAGTAVAQVEATATAALDPVARATTDFQAWQTAQVQATAASSNLQTVQAQATATPQPGGTGTPTPDATATAAVETATAAAQSLQIAEQKVVAAAAELKATATAAASATVTSGELRGRLQTAGLTGRGVKVAIVATGIDPDHPDFVGRIVAGASFVGDKSSYRDDNGFGTFLAGIAVGNGAASGGQYKGWAPEADLYIAKVMEASGAGTMDNIIAGIEWAVEQQVDIVLIGVGGPSGCDGSEALSQEADAAVEAGLVVVVPAGNSGPEPGTIDSPGCARLPITVGAAELNTVAGFSSRGPTQDGRTKPDLLFSGYGVGAQAAGTKIGSEVATSYVEAPGSGAAAAHAAGAIALLLQANPDLTPAEVKDLLMATATDLGFDANAQGTGLANIEKVLARVRDRDGDGFPDAEDVCPDDPGTSLAGGCPEPTPTITPSATPTEIPTPIATPTEILTPTATPTEILTPTATPTEILTPTATPTATPTPNTTPTVAVSLPPLGRLLFARRIEADTYLYIMGADGSTPGRFTDNVLGDPRADYSWTTRRFVFTGRDEHWQIYVMSEGGTDLRNISNNEWNDSAPAWSPDGTRLVFTSDRDGNNEIYVMNADGSEVTRLTDNAANDLFPAWSLDGKRIAFVSDRDGDAEIYVMNADGSEQTNLTNHPAGDLAPSWSPDGERIAFASGRDGNEEIYVMNVDGNQPRNLTNSIFPENFPAWSSDGQWIVFSRFTGFPDNNEIFVMTTTGEQITRLTDDPAYDVWPVWLPPLESR